MTKVNFYVYVVVVIDRQHLKSDAEILLKLLDACCASVFLLRIDLLV